MFCLILALPLVSADVYYYPETPANESIVLTDQVSFVMGINTTDLRYVNWEWNFTNQTLYNKTYSWLYHNFDNVSALGEDDTKAISTDHLLRESYYQNDAEPVVDGKYKGAVYFDGVNDYLNVSYVPGNDPLIPLAPFGSFLNASHITICAWIYPESGPFGVETIFAQENGGGNGQIWMGYNPLMRNHFTDIIEGGRSTLSAQNDVPLNEWSHLCFSITDNGNVKGYVNGVTTANFGNFRMSCIQANGTYRIGLNKNDASDFKGMIDDLQIYNNTITNSTEGDNQILAWYESSFSKYDTNEYNLTKNETELEFGEYWYEAWTKNLTTFENSPLQVINVDLFDLDLNFPFQESATNDDPLNYLYTFTGNADTCKLYDDHLGSWGNIYTNSSIVSGVQDSFSITAGEGDYMWNAWCNTTLGSEITKPYNYTYTIDRTLPFAEFVPPTYGNSTRKTEFVITNLTASDNDNLYSFVDFRRGTSSTKLWVRMDDYNTTTGKVFDLSNYHENGDYVGNAHVVGLAQFGVSTGFDGDGDYIEFPTLDDGAGNFEDDSFSISSWAKTTEKGDTIIADMYATAGFIPATIRGWKLDTTINEGYLRFGTGTAAGTQWTYTTSAYDITDGEWHHVAAVVNSTDVVLYADGTQVATGVRGTIEVDSRREFHIGWGKTQAWFSSIPNYWNGQIDDTLIFDDVLELGAVEGLNSSKTKTFYNSFYNLQDEGYNCYTGYANDRAGNIYDTGTAGCVWVNKSGSCIYKTGYWAGNWYIDCTDNCVPEQLGPNMYGHDVYISGPGLTTFRSPYFVPYDYTKLRVEDRCTTRIQPV